MKRLLQAGMLVLGLLSTTVQAFDHRHQAWTALVKRHVAWLPGGHESRVSYAGMKRDPAPLKSYLEALSAVSESEFNAWPKPRRLAFLINAYNAYTVDLILSRYPDLKSIRDLGSILSSPWKKRFFTLLGQQRSLDDIEHGILVALLRRKIRDERFLNLIWKLLRAGYFDLQKNRHDSLAGTPQGGLATPPTMLQKRW